MRILVILLLLLCTIGTVAQNIPSLGERSAGFPFRFLARVKQQSDKLDKKLLSQTDKYLLDLARKEKRLKGKLAQKDSLQAELLFGNVERDYQNLRETICDTSNASIRAAEYLPHLDTLKTSLAFLSSNNSHLTKEGGTLNPVKDALHSVSNLQSRLEQAEQIKSYLNQRRELLKAQLSQAGLFKDFSKYNRQAYYYSQQLQEIKTVLEDPDQLQKKAISVLRQLPAFQEFMKKHGALASLFGIPDNYASMESLAGLQTRSSVQSLLQSRVSSAGPNGLAALQANVQEAQSQLSKLKDKLSKSGGGAEGDLPDFKPNNQKTKSFLQRIEYGTNLQSQRSSNYFPTTTDIGLSAGYKLNNKSIVGIGVSYKVGWGKDIRNISISNQGVGFRSFADYKIKGSFFASGGFEYNYQEAFSSVSQLRDLDTWQKSGLVGISKIIDLKSKVFKKTKVQLFWDFLSYQQYPQNSAVKFRVGYNF